MSSTDFRKIAARGVPGKSEKLFRAAISAFCSLTRPTHREIGQLEDLVLPLFDSVSPEGLRFVAAALSECDFAPRALVRRLADEPVAIAAPILVRSKSLSDIDLIALIGRHGIPHARAIARRTELNPTIESLVLALFESASRQHAAALNTLVEPAQVNVVMPPQVEPVVKPAPLTVLSSVSIETLLDLPGEDDAADDAPDFGAVANDPIAAPRIEFDAVREPDAAILDTPIRRTFGKADVVREKLRAMMRPVATEDDILELTPLLDASETARLRDTALTGNPAFFQTALADALGIDFMQARVIAGGAGYADLMFALKSLEVGDEQAFVIAAAVYPAAFGHAEAIRLFLERYRLCHAEAARDKVRDWKAESIAGTVRRAKPKLRPEPLDEAANSDARTALLRAS